MTNYQAARQRFANRVRAVRTEKGLTQAQLAERIGKTTEHISLLERAERSPSFEVILDLANVLAVRIAGLFDDHAPSATLAETLGIAPLTYLFPDRTQPPSAIERLNEAFKGNLQGTSTKEPAQSNDWTGSF